MNCRNKHRGITWVKMAALSIGVTRFPQRKPDTMLPESILLYHPDKNTPIGYKKIETMRTAIKTLKQNCKVISRRGIEL